MLATALSVSGPVVPSTFVTTTEGLSMRRLIMPRWNATAMKEEKNITTGSVYLA